MLACPSHSVIKWMSLRWALLIDSICSKSSSCVLTFTEVPAWLCRIRRFRAAAGRKWHRYLQAAAHHRPLHLLHWPQWVNTSLLPFTSSKLPLHTHRISSLFFPPNCSSHEDWLWQHGGEDGVQREVCQPSVFQLQATGQPGAADHQTQQRGRFLFQ